MKFKTKEMKKNNYFILYDMNDEIICYFDNSEEICKYTNYKTYDLVREFNRYNNDIIGIEIDNKKYKLATFR